MTPAAGADRGAASEPAVADASPEPDARQAVLTAYPQINEALNLYVDILASTGIEWGLIGPREGDRLWGRHIANSLAVGAVIPDGLEVADVGSGAGLPGIPLALARPDLAVTLIEPLQRRAQFLSIALEELGLDGRVEVVRGRAEELSRTFDVVTARAVARLDKLLLWTHPLLRADGMLVALKGETAEAEVAAAARRLGSLGLAADVIELPGVRGVEGTRAIRIRRAR